VTLGISSQKVLEVRHAQHVQMSIFANWFANCFAVNNISLTKGARPQVRHAQHVAAGDHLDLGAPEQRGNGLQLSGAITDGRVYGGALGNTSVLVFLLSVGQGLQDVKQCMKSCLSTRHRANAGHAGLRSSTNKPNAVHGNLTVSRAEISQSDATTSSREVRQAGPLLRLGRRLVL